MEKIEDLTKEERYILEYFIACHQYGLVIDNTGDEAYTLPNIEYKHVAESLRGKGLLTRVGYPKDLITNRPLRYRVTKKAEDLYGEEIL